MSPSDLSITNTKSLPNVLLTIRRIRHASDESFGDDEGLWERPSEKQLLDAISLAEFFIALNFEVTITHDVLGSLAFYFEDVHGEEWISWVRPNGEPYLVEKLTGKHSLPLPWIPNAHELFAEWQRWDQESTHPQVTGCAK